MARFSYDPTTAAGVVRLLIADTDPQAYDFLDAEIDVALAQSDDSPKRAAAMLLNALAANRSRLAVSVKRGEVSEDLTKLADALRAQAAAYIEQAESDEDVPLEAIISPTWDRFSYARNIALDREGRVDEAP